MSEPLSYSRLVAEATQYVGTGATSAESVCTPAFRDDVSGRVYPATFADGRPAPLHLLAGLPDHLIAERDAGGRPIAAVASVTPGFIDGDRFFTREEMQRRRNGNTGG